MKFQFVANNVQVLSIDHEQNQDASIKWDTMTIFDPVSKSVATLTADQAAASSVAPGDVINALIAATEQAKQSNNQKAAYIDTKFKIVSVAPCSSDQIIRFPSPAALASGTAALDRSEKSAKGAK